MAALTCCSRSKVFSIDVILAVPAMVTKVLIGSSLDWAFSVCGYRWNRTSTSKVSHYIHQPIDSQFERLVLLAAPLIMDCSANLQQGFICTLQDQNSVYFTVNIDNQGAVLLKQYTVRL